MVMLRILWFSLWYSLRINIWWELWPLFSCCWLEHSNKQTNKQTNTPANCHVLEVKNDLHCSLESAYQKFWTVDPKPSANELAQHYDKVVSTLIELHSLMVTKKISPKPPIPWITWDILAFEKHHRYPECIWCRKLTAWNRSRLTRQTHLRNRQMSKATSAHYSEIIAKHWWSSVIVEGICGAGIAERVSVLDWLSLCCVAIITLCIRTPACALKQGTLPHFLHLWTEM